MGTTSVNPQTSSSVALWQWNLDQGYPTAGYNTLTIGAMIEFEIGGSGSLSVQITGYVQNANPMTIYLDGVSQGGVTLTNSVGQNQTLTIVSGLTGSHKVSIEMIVDNAFNPAESSSWLSVISTTSTPTIAIPTGYTANVHLCSTNNSSVTTLPSNVDIDPFYIPGSNNSAYGNAYGLQFNPNFYLDGGIRINGNGTTLFAYVLQDGTTWGVRANGVNLTPITLANTGTWGLVQFGSLVSAITCDWRISPICPAIAAPNANNLIISDLMLTGGTGITSSAITPQPLYIFLGDSITRKEGQPPASPPPTTAYGFVALIGNMLNVTAVNYGQPGSAAAGSLGGAVTNTLAVTSNPAAVIIHWGTNDVAFWYSFSESLYEPSAYQSAYQSAISALLSGTTTTQIYIVKLLYRNGSGVTNAQIDTYNQILFNVVIAAASPRVHLIDITNDILPTDLGIDNLHPIDGGSFKMAFLIANQIKSLTTTTSNTPQIATTNSTVQFRTRGLLRAG